MSLPQAAGPGQALSREVEDAFEGVLKGQQLDVAGGRMLLLVAGLRPVKDVLYLADAVDAAWGDGSTLRLVVVGGRLDVEYASAVEQRSARSAGAFRVLSATLSRSACIDAMRRCAAVVNCSVSEGMAGALLEAMATSTAVLARDIEGNRALAMAAVEALAAFPAADAFASDGVAPSGAAAALDGGPFDSGGVRLFGSPEDFVAQAEALMLPSGLDGGGSVAAALGVAGVRASRAMADVERSQWHRVLDSITF